MELIVFDLDGTLLDSGGSISDYTRDTLYEKNDDITVLPAQNLPVDAEITNVSAIGSSGAIAGIENLIRTEPHLVAYSGAAWEGDGWCWIDIHHSDTSKGGAIEMLRRQLQASRVVCFGDSDNDLSMFAQADESYAPDNASSHIKKAATAVIGHHDEDGIARFLRQRFQIGS